MSYSKESELFDEEDSYDRNGVYKDYQGYNYKTLDGDTVHPTRYTSQQALDLIDQTPQISPFA